MFFHKIDGTVVDRPAKPSAMFPVLDSYISQGKIIIFALKAILLKPVQNN